MNKEIKIIECPRDAMQGIHDFIPTEKKINLLKSIIKCGFDTIDCGSFVSPKHIPQLADTPDVLRSLENEDLGHTKLLTIVANERGAVRAAAFPLVKYLGYPFSVSETFQRKNTNASRQDAFFRLKSIKEIADASSKEVVAYISMAFGNPYDEEYRRDEVIEWAERIADLGIKTISLADTVGQAQPKDIKYLFSHLIPHLPNVEFGAHFHSEPSKWQFKIEEAYKAGCTRFDGAFYGVGGCPMAGNDLVGNIATENLIQYFSEKESLNLKLPKVQESMKLALETYGN